MADAQDSAVRMPPVVVDLGKVRKKKIRQLKEGRGELLEEVEQTLEEVRVHLGEHAEGKELLPIVFLYRKKPKRPKRGFLSLF